MRRFVTSAAALLLLLSVASTAMAQVSLGWGQPPSAPGSTQVDDEHPRPSSIETESTSVRIMRPPYFKSVLSEPARPRGA